MGATLIVRNGGGIKREREGREKKEEALCDVARVTHTVP